jgi:hypothetical protein
MYLTNACQTPANSDINRTFDEGSLVPPQDYCDLPPPRRTQLTEFDFPSAIYTNPSAISKTNSSAENYDSRILMAGLLECRETDRDLAQERGIRVIEIYAKCI